MTQPDSHSEHFATARDIAQRWCCHVDTVYSRLERANVTTYRFTARLVRWKWSDVFAFEDALAAGEAVDETSALIEYVSHKRGPRRMTVMTDD